MKRRVRRVIQAHCDAARIYSPAGLASFKDSLLFRVAFHSSDVAYLCGAPVKSETRGRKPGSFFVSLFDSFFFLLLALDFFFLSSPLSLPPPPFYLFVCFVHLLKRYHSCFFDLIKHFIFLILSCLCWLFCYVSKFELKKEREKESAESTSFDQVFHSEIVCPKDAPNFRLQKR